MMPTRWPSYILVILAAVLGGLIPFALPRIWVWIGGATRQRTEAPQKSVALNSCASPISVRFHLAALLFLGFLALALLGLPFLFTLEGETAGISSALLVSLTLPSTIALFYGLRKGDLSWSVSRARDDVGEDGRFP